MSDQEEKAKFGDIEIDEWKVAFSPNVREYPATRFVIIPDGDLVRFAFGNSGSPVDETGKRGIPIFSVAISMSPYVAAQLRDVLNRIIQTKKFKKGQVMAQDNIIPFPWADIPRINRSGGRGGGFDGMEPGLAILETHVEYIKGDVSEIKTACEAVRADVVAARVQIGQLVERVSHLPSKGFIDCLLYWT